MNGRRIEAAFLKFSWKTVHEKLLRYGKRLQKDWKGKVWENLLNPGNICGMITPK